MRILVACEFSGRVRQAFRTYGHTAYSCDYLPTDDKSPYHLQQDVMPLLRETWDMIIAFPPCTYLCRSGARWWKGKELLQEQAIAFFMTFVRNSCPRIAIENPIGIMSRLYRKPDQILQPLQFGNQESKATCLWLKGLPCLYPTDIQDMFYPKCHKMPPGPNRSKLRSTTYQGIADAMALQWG